MKLKNRIFHIMTISLLILSAVLLSACGKQETAGSMKLTKAELSHKEKALADLLAPVGSSRLFDFTVDETIRQVTVTTYELKNGQWDWSTSNSTPCLAARGFCSILKISLMDPTGSYRSMKTCELPERLKAPKSPPPRPPVLPDSWSSLRILSRRRDSVILQILDSGGTRDPDLDFFHDPSRQKAMDMTGSFVLPFLLARRL